MDPLTGLPDQVTVAAPRVAAWLLFWVGFGGLDYWADSRGQSLSRATRHAFRTHHPVGRLTFTSALIVGAVVLNRHILKQAEQVD